MGAFTLISVTPREFVGFSFTVPNLSRCLSLFSKFRFRRCSSQNKVCGVGFAQGDSLTITYSFGVLHPVANASA